MKKLARRFEPEDEVLIDSYLRNKINNPSFQHRFIAEATIFGEEVNPWEKLCSEGNAYPWQHRVTGDMGTEEDYDRLFVFTKVTSVGTTEKSSNIQKKRNAGCGTWKMNNKHKVEHSARPGVVIGHSKLLTFIPSKGHETLGHWTMNEYTINPAAYPGIQGSGLDWENQVLCKIKRHYQVDESSLVGKVIKSSKKKDKECKSKSRKRRQISTPIPASSKEDEVQVPLVNLDHQVEGRISLDAIGFPQPVISDDGVAAAVSLNEEELRLNEELMGYFFTVPDDWEKSKVNEEELADDCEEWTADELNELFDSCNF